jgi:hypothetical protein
MRKARSVAVCAAAALAVNGTGVIAKQFVPPAGYSGQPGAAVADIEPEPGGPRLVAIPQPQASFLVRADPSYRRMGRASHVKVVGAFKVIEPAGSHLVGATGRGFLPVILLFSNGDCYSLDTDYVGGALSNGRLKRVECQTFPAVGEQPPPPSDQTLHLVGHSWGYGAWVGAGGQLTTISAPFGQTFQPLFEARMAAIAILAMNGPDYPGGDVTLVGTIKEQPIVMTMEVGW